MTLLRPPARHAPRHAEAAAPMLDGLPPAWLVRPLAAALGLLAGASIVGVLAAMLEVFEPGVVVAGSAALGGPLAWASARALPSWRSDRSVHAAAALVVALVAAITLYNGLHHGQHIVAERDPGVYITTAKHLADHGDLLVHGPSGPFVDAEGVSPNGAGFSNVRDDGTLEPQFPHLTAVLLAMGAWVSDSVMFLLTPAIAGWALLALYVWGSTVTNARWAALGVAVAGTTMPFMVFARDAYSEPIAMLLVFGGLALVHVADASRRWPVWFLSGLVLGATSMARVDGYLYLAPALLALALAARLAPRARRLATLRDVGLCVLGLVITSAIGIGDTASFTGGYYDELRSRLPAMLGAAVIAAVLGWFAARALWNMTGAPDRREWRGAGWVRRVHRALRWPGGGPGHRDEIGPTPLLLGTLMLAALGLTAFFAWGYWVRPDASGLPSVAREGMNVLSLLPQARSLSVRWLEWYLGPVGLTAGLGGVVWLLLGIGRAGRPEPARIAGLAIIIVTLVLYLWTPSVTPDQPWAMRRFAAVALPGLAIGAASVCRALWPRRIGPATRDEPAPRTASTALQVLRPGLAIAVALGTLGATLAITWPTRGARAQIPMRERMGEICEVIDDDDAVLVPIDGILALMMAVPVGVWCDVPSAGGTSRLDAVDVAELADEWAREGRDLVVLSSSATPLANTLLGTGIVQDTIQLAPVFPEAIEPTITRRPDDVVTDDRLGKGPQGEITFYIYEIDLRAARRLLRADQRDSSLPAADPRT